MSQERSEGRASRVSDFTTVREIFLQALELDVVERRSYLDEVCDEDEALRLEVEDLLSSASEDFMRDPTVPDNVIDIPDKSPRRIGAYLFREKIGEGGCGSVYLADQESPVRRRVALKLIKPGMDSREVVRRFETERQTLAMMEHPNIATVFDAGQTEAGHPYFVMEYVEGAPITEFCDRRGTNLKERLELFVKVCRAVQHAHQKGVIHRDLKPSNLLVTMKDGVALPKVIDFGIAKAIAMRISEDTLAAYGRQFFGTPAYVSPEQLDPCRHDIDTRSDVYSLGIVLYELLTGSAPHSSETLLRSGFEKMRRLLCEVNPPKPSTRVRSLSRPEQAALAARFGQVRTPDKNLQGDLDRIVLKAIEKQRDRRYDSALQLAEDIERHLRHEPVRARSPGVCYLAGCFIRRNAVAVAFVFVLCIAALVAAGGVLSGLASARKEARIAAEAASKADALARSMFEILFTGSPSAGYSADFRVRDLLLQFEDTIRARLADHPELEARALARLGAVFNENSQYNRAAPVLERAMHLAADQFGETSEEWVYAANLLSEVRYHQGRYARAAALEDGIHRVQVILLGESAPDTVMARMQAAYFRYMAGELSGDQMFPVLLQAEARLLNSDSPRAKSVLLTVYHSHYVVLDGLNRYAEAENYARKRLQIANSISENPSDSTVLFSKELLAGALRGQGKFENAEKLLKQIARATRRLYGEESGEAADGHLESAKLYVEWGRLDEAEAAAGEALEIGEKISGDSPRWKRWAREQLEHIRELRAKTRE